MSAPKWCKGPLPSLATILCVFFLLSTIHAEEVMEGSQTEATNKALAPDIAALWESSESTEKSLLQSSAKHHSHHSHHSHHQHRHHEHHQKHLEQQKSESNEVVLVQVEMADAMATVASVAFKIVRAVARYYELKEARKQYYLKMSYFLQEFKCFNAIAAFEMSKMLDSWSQYSDEIARSLTKSLPQPTPGNVKADGPPECNEKPSHTLVQFIDERCRLVKEPKCNQGFDYDEVASHVKNGDTSRVKELLSPAMKFLNDLCRNKKGEKVSTLLLNMLTTQSQDTAALQNQARNRAVKACAGPFTSSPMESTRFSSVLDYLMGQTRLVTQSETEILGTRDEEMYDNFVKTMPVTFQRVEEDRPVKTNNNNNGGSKKERKQKQQILLDTASTTSPTPLVLLDTTSINGFIDDLSTMVTEKAGDLFEGDEPMFDAFLSAATQYMLDKNQKTKPINILFEQISKRCDSLQELARFISDLEKHNFERANYLQDINIVLTGMGHPLQSLNIFDGNNKEVPAMVLQIYEAYRYDRSISGHFMNQICSPIIKSYAPKANAVGKLLNQEIRTMEQNIKRQCQMAFQISLQLMDRSMDSSLRSKALDMLRDGNPAFATTYLKASFESKRAKLDLYFDRLMGQMEQTGCLAIRYQQQAQFERHLSHSAAAFSTITLTDAVGAVVEVEEEERQDNSNYDLSIVGDFFHMVDGDTTTITSSIPKIIISPPSDNPGGSSTSSVAAASAVTSTSNLSPSDELTIKPVSTKPASDPSSTSSVVSSIFDSGNTPSSSSTLLPASSTSLPVSSPTVSSVEAMKAEEISKNRRGIRPPSFVNFIEEEVALVKEKKKSDKTTPSKIDASMPKSTCSLESMMYCVAKTVQSFCYTRTMGKPASVAANAAKVKEDGGDSDSLAAIVAEHFLTWSEYYPPRVSISGFSTEQITSVLAKTIIDKTADVESQMEGAFESAARRIQASTKGKSNNFNLYEQILSYALEFESNEYAGYQATKRKSSASLSKTDRYFIEAKNFPNSYTLYKNTLIPIAYGCIRAAEEFPQEIGSSMRFGFCKSGPEAAQYLYNLEMPMLLGVNRWLTTPFFAPALETGSWTSIMCPYQHFLRYNRSPLRAIIPFSGVSRFKPPKSAPTAAKDAALPAPAPATVYEHTTYTFESSGVDKVLSYRFQVCHTMLSSKRTQSDNKVVNWLKEKASQAYNAGRSYFGLQEENIETNINTVCTMLARGTSLLNSYEFCKQLVDEFKNILNLQRYSNIRQCMNSLYSYYQPDFTRNEYIASTQRWHTLCDQVDTIYSGKDVSYTQCIQSITMLAGRSARDSSFCAYLCTNNGADALVSKVGFDFDRCQETCKTRLFPLALSHATRSPVEFRENFCRWTYSYTGAQDNVPETPDQARQLATGELKYHMGDCKRLAQTYLDPFSIESFCRQSCEPVTSVFKLSTERCHKICPLMLLPPFATPDVPIQKIAKKNICHNLDAHRIFKDYYTYSSEREGIIKFLIQQHRVGCRMFIINYMKQLITHTCEHQPFIQNHFGLSKADHHKFTLYCNGFASNPLAATKAVALAAAGIDPTAPQPAVLTEFNKIVLNMIKDTHKDVFPNIVNNYKDGFIRSFAQYLCVQYRNLPNCQQSLYAYFNRNQPLTLENKADPNEYLWASFSTSFPKQWTDDDINIQIPRILEKDKIVARNEANNVATTISSGGPYGVAKDYCMSVLREKRLCPLFSFNCNAEDKANGICNSILAQVDADGGKFCAALTTEMEEVPSASKQKKCIVELLTKADNIHESFRTRFLSRDQRVGDIYPLSKRVLQTQRSFALFCASAPYLTNGLDFANSAQSCLEAYDLVQGKTTSVDDFCYAYCYISATAFSSNVWNVQTFHSSCMSSCAAMVRIFDWQKVEISGKTKSSRQDLFTKIQCHNALRELDTVVGKPFPTIPTPGTYNIVMKITEDNSKERESIIQDFCRTYMPTIKGYDPQAQHSDACERATKDSRREPLQFCKLVCDPSRFNGQKECTLKCIRFIWHALFKDDYLTHACDENVSINGIDMKQLKIQDEANTMNSARAGTFTPQEMYSFYENFRYEISRARKIECRYIQYNLLVSKLPGYCRLYHSALSQQTSQSVVPSLRNMLTCSRVAVKEEDILSYANDRCSRAVAIHEQLINVFVTPSSSPSASPSSATKQNQISDYSNSWLCSYICSKIVQLDQDCCLSKCAYSMNDYRMKHFIPWYQVAIADASPHCPNFGYANMDDAVKHHDNTVSNSNGLQTINSANPLTEDIQKISAKGSLTVTVSSYNIAANDARYTEEYLSRNFKYQLSSDILIDYCVATLGKKSQGECESVINNKKTAVQLNSIGPMCDTIYPDSTFALEFRRRGNIEQCITQSLTKSEQINPTYYWQTVRKLTSWYMFCSGPVTLVTPAPFSEKEAPSVCHQFVHQYGVKTIADDDICYYYCEKGIRSGDDNLKLCVNSCRAILSLMSDDAMYIPGNNNSNQKKIDVTLTKNPSYGYAYDIKKQSSGLAISIFCQQYVHSFSDFAKGSTLENRKEACNAADRQSFGEPVAFCDLACTRLFKSANKQCFTQCIKFIWLATQKDQVLAHSCVPQVQYQTQDTRATFSYSNYKAPAEHLSSLWLQYMNPWYQEMRSYQCVQDRLKRILLYWPVLCRQNLWRKKTMDELTTMDTSQTAMITCFKSESPTLNDFKDHVTQRCRKIDHIFPLKSFSLLRDMKQHSSDIRSILEASICPKFCTLDRSSTPNQCCMNQCSLYMSSAPSSVSYFQTIKPYLDLTQPEA